MQPGRGVHLGPERGSEVVKPLITKCSKVAAITDGEMIVKITCLMSFSKVGVSYIIKGHELRDKAPPKDIDITARTQFFKAPARLFAEEDVLVKAEDLLHPLAPVTNLKRSSTNVGLITIEREVSICAAIRIDIALGFRSH